MAQHITTDSAYSIDLDWQNADADTADMLPRLVSYKHATLLTIPSLNGSAPTYQYRSHDPETGAFAPAYYHMSGPTMDAWYAQRDAAELEGVLQAEYRDDYDTRRDLRSAAVQ